MKAGSRASRASAWVKLSAMPGRPQPDSSCQSCSFRPCQALPAPGRLESTTSSQAQQKS